MDYFEYDKIKTESDYEDEFHDNPTEIHSLLKLCLKTVIQNLDRFTSVYATSEDISLRRNLLFLQRAYAELIIKEVKDDIKDSWLDFLLNEHLTKFTMSDFISCNLDALLKRFEAMGHAFLEVYLDSFLNDKRNKYVFKSFEQVLKIMKLIPNVQTLLLHHFINEDAVLTTIGDYCPGLRELFIDTVTCSEAGFRSLFRVHEDGTVTPKCRLEVLSLKEVDIEIPALVYVLQHMPTLQTLSHRLVPSALYSMHKYDFRTCGTQYGLTSLDLRDLDNMTCDLDGVLRVCASVCPAVTRLQTSVDSQSQLEELALFRTEELVLKGLNTTIYANKLDLNGYLATNGDWLRELRLFHVSVSVITLLERCQGLQSLYLSGVYLSDPSSSPSTTLPGLRKLVLEEPSVEQSVAAEAALLTACPNLKVLGLHGSWMDGLETALSVFCQRCATLTELHFRESDVHARLVESILLTSPSLKMLLIHNCEYIMFNDSTNFHEIARARKNKIKFVWHEEWS